jgi:iron complex transport system substrate-binding protein
VRALGARPQLVGISHACGRGPELAGIPVLTASRVPDGGAGGVDADVRRLAQAGEDLYAVDVEALRRAEPDVILAQELCRVCAVSAATAARALRGAGLHGSVVVLRGDSLESVGADAMRVGAAIGRAREGRAVARAFAASLRASAARAAGRPRPRVASLEWLDPPYAAGHWVPEMIRLAGGEEVLGGADRASRRTTWSEVEAAAPDVLAILPCGFDVPRARADWEAARRVLAAARSPLSALPAVLLDAARLASRPAPALARGVEVLGALLHPGAGFPPPGSDEGLRLRPDTAAGR